MGYVTAMSARSPGLTFLALLVTGCVTTTTTSRMWDAPPDRGGQVAWIRESVQRQEGNPGAGAAVGAIVGGLFGNAMSGGHPGGTLMGAVGGAAVGASASQGSAERHTYEVAVQFDDGAQQVFLFSGYCPFRVGEGVIWTQRGLVPNPASPGAPPPPNAGPPPSAAGPPSAPPYPPPAQVPPPPPPPY